MYSPQPPRRLPPNSEECKIEIKNTKSGKKIRISGRCSKEQLLYAKEATGVHEVEGE